MMPQSQWLPFAPIRELDTGAVVLWRVGLELEEEAERRLEKMLSEEERARAGRFYFPHLSRRFIAAHSALRILAGMLAGLPPADVEFGYAQHGKPFLPGSPLRFNLSHAHELALIAFAHHREVGVDVEKRRHLPDGEAIARRFFSRAEVAAFLDTPAADRSTAFFNGWTRKEAYIKAIGDGLSYPLNQFEVTLKPGRPARLLAVHTNPDEVQRWKLDAVDPGPGYAGAVIAEGQDWELVQQDFRFPG